MVLAALSLTVVGLAVSGVTSSSAPFPAATPQGKCRGAQDKLETGLQGRVPQADYDNGRAKRGYRCNTQLLSHQGTSGGFKVLRYRDSQGHVCAFYDSTRVFPTDVFLNGINGSGVIVLDMANPAKPRQTANLQTAAMLSPHESLLLHEKRGLLVAVLGNAFANVGVMDIYDVRTNCRKPRLVSSSPSAVLGHESGFAPDGRTFYAASSGGQTFVAVDVSNPARPRTIFVQRGVNYHGLRLSNDGRTMYAANISNDLAGATLPGEGLRILDVSQIQDRKPNPEVRIVSDLVWRERSIPQVAQPFRRGKRDYVLQVDEFAKIGLTDMAGAPVGAARIIDVNDPAHPRVVSNLRLQVHQPAARRTSFGDPGASSPVGGYAAHYCSLPYRNNPRIAACSMIASGLRIFDISNLKRPVEIAYFNQPTVPATPADPRTGASALSQPAWDVKGRSIWYSDGNSGFYAVRLINGVWKLLQRRR